MQKQSPKNSSGSKLRNLALSHIFRNFSFLQTENSVWISNNLAELSEIRAACDALEKRVGKKEAQKVIGELKRKSCSGVLVTSAEIIKTMNSYDV